MRIFFVDRDGQEREYCNLVKVKLTSDGIIELYGLEGLGLSIYEYRLLQIGMEKTYISVRIKIWKKFFRVRLRLRAIELNRVKDLVSALGLTDWKELYRLAKIDQLEAIEES